MSENRNTGRHKADIFAGNFKTDPYWWDDVPRDADAGLPPDALPHRRLAPAAQFLRRPAVMQPVMTVAVPLHLLAPPWHLSRIRATPLARILQHRM